MGLIGTVVLAVLAEFVACLPRLFTDEFKAWVPWLVEKLISRAVARAPKRYRERLAEEWRSHTNDTPGILGKLYVALGLFWASGTLTKDAEQTGAEPDDLREPTMEEILASIRRIIVEDGERFGERAGDRSIDPDLNAWPPICNVSPERRHRVPGAAIYFSTRYGGRTFQGPCALCHEWIDTGEWADY
jgi:hypothetical protein